MKKFVIITRCPSYEYRKFIIESESMENAQQEIYDGGVECNEMWSEGLYDEEEIYSVKEDKE
jgi:hypothetical protein